MNAQVLRIALAKIGLPQIGLAKKIGVDNSTFSRWKNNWQTVPIHYRSKIAQILEVDEKELFPEESPSK